MITKDQARIQALPEPLTARKWDKLPEIKALNKRFPPGHDLVLPDMWGTGTSKNKAAKWCETLLRQRGHPKAPPELEKFIELYKPYLPQVETRADFEAVEPGHAFVSAGDSLVRWKPV